MKKNAILMIDFALAAERNEGKNSRDSIFEACLLRFRPILMTTMAAILGAVPLALGTGTGSEFRRPLGIAIIGGLAVSQLLTLYTHPWCTSILIVFNVGGTVCTSENARTPWPGQRRPWGKRGNLSCNSNYGTRSNTGGLILPVFAEVRWLSAARHLPPHGILLTGCFHALQNPNSDHYDCAYRDPVRGHVQQVRRIYQTTDNDRESNRVKSERHSFSLGINPQLCDELAFWFSTCKSITTCFTLAPLWIPAQHSACERACPLDEHGTPSSQSPW